MKTRFLLALLAAATAAYAAEAPQPGPEQKRADYMLGKWTIESDSKASPFGPAGKNTGVQVCEAGPGGFSVLFKSEFKTPGGTIVGVATLA